MKPAGRDLKPQQVAGQLRRSILSGAFPRGSLLPGENDLAKQFSVSRTTIRGALKKLANDQLIDTQSGVGSFVTFDGLSIEGPSWGRALATVGIDATVEVLRLEHVVDPDLAAAVGASSMDFIAVDRIRRLATGSAISLERSRVPAVGPLAAAPQVGLVEDSLSQTMTAAGLYATRGEQWICAAGLSAQDARLLDRAPGELFLNSVRVARNAEGQFVERVGSWLDPQHFRLHLNFGE